MTRRRWFWIVVSLLFAALALIAATEPYHFLPGLVGGDAFYRLRPTRYWREVLRADGAAGTISTYTLARFKFGERSSLPVLRECLRDPDPNVRWPAVNLLRWVWPFQAAVPDVVAALDDPDMEVRLQAIRSLEANGRDSASAAPHLVRLLQSPDDRLAFFAERALWRIDPETGVEKCGWKRLTVERWRFSAVFPKDFEVKTMQMPSPAGLVPLHSWMAMRGPNAYTVAVSEYTDEQVKEIPPDVWFQRLKEQTGPMGLHVVRDNPIQQGDLTGREQISEGDGNGRIWARLFWVGRRLYQVTVTFMPEFANPAAARYFMDSFQIETSDKPRTP